MKLSDLSISAKMTIATTSSVLLVFLLVSVAIMWGLGDLYRGRALGLEGVVQANEAEVDRLLEQKTVRSLDSAGALLAEVAGHHWHAPQVDRLRRMADLVEQDPEFSFVDIRDTAGASLIGKTGELGRSYRQFPIVREGTTSGLVVIGLASGFQPAVKEELLQGLNALLAASQDQRQVALALIVALVLFGAMVTGAVIYLSISRLTKRYIAVPTLRIRHALQSMERRRDYSERVRPEADDELGATVHSFNRGLDFLDRQNEQLNDSVIELLQVGNEIAQARDLSLTVPVKEDITGPLRDALNRITSESARVLLKVREVAGRVADATARVQDQGANVVAVANAERVLIEQTASELAGAVEAIDQVAELAQLCNDAAKEASESTDQALASVRKAVEGMGNIRGTIQETGKRIKRLGERSQEISGIVDIINSFAERTHVLAINASMQAATSGEAGRGFAVVAQEVQRLADSSRNATSQIAALISNIQIETSDTIQTVNQATEAVGTESRTVESAGERMKETQKATANLARAVEQIDARSREQVKANRKLLETVDAMRARTVETTEQLDQQTNETSQLFDDSKELMTAIELFRLPGQTLAVQTHS